MSRSPDPDLAALATDPRVLWSEDVLRFCDTDMNGHVNNAVFSAFCESGRVNALRVRLDPTREPDTFFVVARLAIEFRGELHYPGIVRCGTWIEAVGRSSVTFAQVLLDDTGRLVGRSQAVTVLMDQGTRRPRPLDDASRAAVEAVKREA